MIYRPNTGGFTLFFEFPTSCCTPGTTRRHARRTHRTAVTVASPRIEIVTHGPPRTQTNTRTPRTRTLRVKRCSSLSNRRINDLVGRAPIGAKDSDVHHIRTDSNPYRNRRIWEIPSVGCNRCRSLTHFAVSAAFVFTRGPPFTRSLNRPSSSLSFLLRLATSISIHQ